MKGDINSSTPEEAFCGYSQDNWGLLVPLHIGELAIGGVSREVIRNTASGKYRARREKADTKEHSGKIPADSVSSLKSLSP